jgi:hypothetical protein
MLAILAPATAMAIGRLKKKPWIGGAIIRSYCLVSSGVDAL